MALGSSTFILSKSSSRVLQQGNTFAIQGQGVSLVQCTDINDFTKETTALC
jgi:hypothetical protein